mmetsp:Transcript_26623/g.83645  ORF Transcript_26623/g.83645 Transcript_26623/m.83645 type:complete len:237 (+) Transcript_26623:73-783(+)
MIDVRNRIYTTQRHERGDDARGTQTKAQIGPMWRQRARLSPASLPTCTAIYSDLLAVPLLSSRVSTPAATSLLVDPALAVRGPGADTLGEPQLNLLLGVLDRIGAVADVPADLDAKVAADGAGLALGGLGRAEHLAAGDDSAISRPHHAEDRAGHHVVDHALEETLAGKVGVVLLHVLARRRHQLGREQLEALLLEALEDVTDQPALHAVGLDHDVSALHLAVVAGHLDVPTSRGG